MGRFTLQARGILDVEHLMQVLQVHSLPIQEELDVPQRSVTRLVQVDGVHCKTRLTFLPKGIEVDAEALASVQPRLSGVLDQWLGLAQPGFPSLQRLALDPLLGPVATCFPHLRLIGYPDFFEALMTAILGQQISTRAARTLSRRYTGALGRPHPCGLTAFPDAAATAAAGPGRLAEIIGCPASRALTMHRVADWFINEHPLLGGDRQEIRRSLLRIKGVGPWTADYVALRGLRDPTIFLGSDLVVRRGLERLGYSGNPKNLDWGRDNSMATVLLWRFAHTLNP